LPGVRFLNAPDAIPFSHIQDHSSIEVLNISHYVISNVLYGVPLHICPAAAVYEKAHIVEKNNVSDFWEVITRNRIIII